MSNDNELINRLRNRENIRPSDIIDNKENIKTITEGASSFYYEYDNDNKNKNNR